jgi:hypothetical protein
VVTSNDAFGSFDDESAIGCFSDIKSVWPHRDLSRSGRFLTGLGTLCAGDIPSRRARKVRGPALVTISRGPRIFGTRIVIRARIVKHERFGIPNTGMWGNRPDKQKSADNQGLKIVAIGTG